MIEIGMGRAKPGAPDTSYPCVDTAGKVFSATPSDDAREPLPVPDLSLIILSRRVRARPDPKHPACIRPEKLPRLTAKRGWLSKEGVHHALWNSGG